MNLSSQKNVNALMAFFTPLIILSLSNHLLINLRVQANDNFSTPILFFIGLNNLEDLKDLLCILFLNLEFVIVQEKFGYLSSHALKS